MALKSSSSKTTSTTMTMTMKTTTSNTKRCRRRKPRLGRAYNAAALVAFGSMAIVASAASIRALRSVDETTASSSASASSSSSIEKATLAAETVESTPTTTTTTKIQESKNRNLKEIQITTTKTISNNCPKDYTGRTPTSSCAGYADCLNGNQVAKYSCGSGTIYDSSSGICNWPSAVICTFDASLLQQEEEEEEEEDNTENDNDTTDEGGNTDSFDFSTNNPCPPSHTGTIPSPDCLGHIYCTNGSPGLSSKCPPGTRYNAMSMTCQSQDLVKCENLSKPPSDAEVGTYVNIKSLEKYGGLSGYCPDDYTGRAPTSKCGGYVDCMDGSVPKDGMGVRYCPSGTKFDIMTRSCISFLANDNRGEEFVCEALHVGPEIAHDDGTMMDDSTMTTTDPTKDKDKERIIVPDGCPEGHTGYAPKAGCTKYVYCQSGVVKATYSCSSGTLFDSNLGYCNWKDSVVCPTSSPSYSPTLSPISPTSSPTISPTELDLNGVLYYPNFRLGVCVNDGNQPPGVSKNYLYSTSAGCCNVFFQSKFDECVEYTKPKITEGPSSAPSGSGRDWYPDYEGGGCLNDGRFSEWESNFFHDYEKCCQFEWLDYELCMAKKPGPPTASPTAGIKYYPDYLNNLCLSDGMQSEYETNLFDSFEDCCRYQWIDYNFCIKYPPGTMVPNSAVGTLWYPDYDAQICRNDGQQAEFEVNLYATRLECCKFPWINYETCINAPEDQYSNPTNPDSPSNGNGSDNSGNNDEWYPDFRLGYCKNDGYPPQFVMTSDSFDDCCTRFYSAELESCRNKSQGIGVDTVDDSNGGYYNEPVVPQVGWYPDFDTTTCRDDGKGPEGVALSDTYRLCCSKFFMAQRHSCYTNSAPDTNPPTPNPTMAPTNEPTPKPTRKRKTKQPTPAPTALSTDMPTYFPTKDPTNRPTRTPTHHPTDSPQSLWYPDISTSRCMKNPEYIPPLVSSFQSYQECCNYAWIVYVDDCLADAEEKENVFYPDYFSGVCLNDGRQSPYENNLFTSADECCRHPMMEYTMCMEKFNDDSGSGSGRPDKVYYPDYFFNVCRHDGKQSPSETNLFNNVEDCCSIDWMEKEGCLANSP